MGEQRQPITDRHVAVDGLSKTYPGAGRPAVDRVSFSLERGEMLALLGPSGCGKTTILRMIAGLVEPSGGRILIDGRDVSHIPVHRRAIGMVFQSYALFPHMNVAQNVAFGLEMRGVGRAEREERVRKALELVKLSGLEERRISQLSGGQQQRAAIARSLVIEPALLLLDEPLSNLDAKLRDEMRDEIRDIQARTRITTIFVTHDQAEALSMADRVGVMSNGLLEQVGAPREIFDRPRTEFVARFIGAGNFLSGRVSAPGTALVDGLGPIRFAGEAPPGAELTLMIRPHRFHLAKGAESEAGNVFTGTVAGMVYRGETLSLTVLAGPHALKVDLPTHAAQLPGKGDAIVLGVDPHDVTLLPAEVS
jgi:putative spermidine/putrescine transport system ATP-binding protein